MPTHAEEIAADYRQSPEYDDHPPTVCSWCKKVIPDDDPRSQWGETCEDCGAQEIEENILDTEAERLLGELGEALAGYKNGRNERLESSGGRRTVALMSLALFLLEKATTGEEGKPK